jgi:hypothetical protein
MTETNESNKWPAILSAVPVLGLGPVGALLLPSLLFEGRNALWAVSQMTPDISEYKGSGEISQTATATAFPIPSSVHQREVK